MRNRVCFLDLRCFNFSCPPIWIIQEGFTQLVISSSSLQNDKIQAPHSNYPHMKNSLPWKRSFRLMKSKHLINFWNITTIFKSQNIVLGNFNSLILPPPMSLLNLLKKQFVFSLTCKWVSKAKKSSSSKDNNSILVTLDLILYFYHKYLAEQFYNSVEVKG